MLLTADKVPWTAGGQQRPFRPSLVVFSFTDSGDVHVVPPSEGCPRSSATLQILIQMWVYQRI